MGNDEKKRNEKINDEYKSVEDIEERTTSIDSMIYDSKINKPF